MKFKLSYVFFPILLVLLLMVTACSKGNSSLEEIYVFAADMDNDGKITIADYNIASSLI